MKIELTETQAYDVYNQVKTNIHNRTDNPYVVELNETHKNRIESMKRFKQRKETEAYEAKLKEQIEIETAYGMILSLRERIEQILETGNACLQYGIPIWKNTHNFDGARYINGCFESDGIHHQLGFINLHNKYGDPKPKEYKYIGFEMGGAWGYYDFWTNGIDIWDVNENNREDKKVASLEHINEFLSKFDRFEKMFYEYVDSTTKGE